MSWLEINQRNIKKRCKNIVSKQNFARWQGVLFCFNLEIEFIKAKHNFSSDFFTYKFLEENDLSESSM